VTSISIATNASLCDLHRLRMILPHWARTFDDRVGEIVVVVDEREPEGRIGRLHGKVYPKQAIYDELERLGRIDARLRWVPLTLEALAPTSRKWFRRGQPIRCHDGSPIYAFVRSVEEARGEVVLRADCDMLFVEQGWLAEACALLEAGSVDLIGPPRLGGSMGPISSRAFLLQPKGFAQRCLPLAPCKVDWMRRPVRFLQGRPRWKALEDHFRRAEAEGRLRYRTLDPSLGCSLHVIAISEVEDPGFARVVQELEAGRIPRAQAQSGWDYVPRAWLGAG
jgi:hypothetical protein